MITFLGHLLDDDEIEETKRESKHYIDFDLTVKDVISKIESGFPKTYKDCEESNFVPKSRAFVNSLVHNAGKLEAVLNTVPIQCSYCSHPLDDWNHKSPKSYFISMGHLRQITIKVKVCSKCRRAFYPDFYQQGIIFLHNKLMVSIEAILDQNQVMQTGGGFIEAIKKKICLLGKLEGIPDKVLKSDSVSIALKMEKIVVGVMSLIVKGADMDSVLCYICGIVPKIVCTDGNTKVGYNRNTNVSYSKKLILTNLDDIETKSFFDLKGEGGLIHPPYRNLLIPLVLSYIPESNVNILRYCFLQFCCTILN